MKGKEKFTEGKAKEVWTTGRDGGKGKSRKGQEAEDRQADPSCSMTSGAMKQGVPTKVCLSR